MPACSGHKSPLVVFGEPRGASAPWRAVINLDESDVFLHEISLCGPVCALVAGGVIDRVIYREGPELKNLRSLGFRGGQGGPILHLGRRGPYACKVPAGTFGYHAAAREALAERSSKVKSALKFQFQLRGGEQFQFEN